MAERLFVGIDNGVTGAITVLNHNGIVLLHKNTPVKKCLSYTKKKQWITRVDFVALHNVVMEFNYHAAFCFIERPFTGSVKQIKAVVSGARCFEATEIMLELFDIPYQVIDSGEWQNVFLPKGLKKEELKIAANRVGQRLFPKLKIVNADSLLIAEHCRRTKR